ncbi:MAG: hypothetical protein WDZ91_08585 [Paenibacillaceae bacterium]
MEHQQAKANSQSGNTSTNVAAPQSPEASFAYPGVAQLLQMQRTMGNRAVLQMMKQSQASRPSAVIQRKEGEESSKLDSDLAKFRSRCDKYGKVLNAAFVAKFEKYVQFLAAGNEEEGSPLLQEVLAYLQQVKAFQIPADKFDSVDPADADKFSQNTNLWSKTNKFLPNQKAAETEGVTLESSLAGFLFDGLDFGINYSTSKLLQAQWQQVSQNFISNAKGTIHAHILMGMNEQSVLFKTEAPVVTEKLEKGEVTLVKVTYYHSDLNGKMDEYKTVDVTTAEEWKALLADTVPVIPIGSVKTKDGTKRVITKINTSGEVYKAIQNITHMAEIKRNEEGVE